MSLFFVGTTTDETTGLKVSLTISRLEVGWTISGNYPHCSETTKVGI